MPPKVNAQAYLGQVRDCIAKYGFPPTETVGSPGRSLAEAIRRAKSRGVFNVVELKELNSELLQADAATWEVPSVVLETEVAAASTIQAPAHAPGGDG